MRAIFSTDIKPVTSEASTPANAVIPPFFFLGELEIGTSGFWSPPHPIKLINGYVSSKVNGTATAGFAIIKKNPLIPDGVILGSVLLGPTQGKNTFTINHYVQAKVINPLDKVYVASFADTGHEDVTLQIHGIRL